MSTRGLRSTQNATPPARISALTEGLTVKTLVAFAVAMFAVAMSTGGAEAATAPPKLVPSAHLDNGFEYPQSVAVAPTGNVYVADRGNNRVQELTPAGGFVLMFGWDVNKTKLEASAPQAERNICTAASKDVCQAGVEGTAAGQFALVYSLTVDPGSGDVYAQETRAGNYRVDKFTADGHFVWMLGKQVNATTGGNLCTAASGDACKAGVAAGAGSVEEGAFNFANLRGDLLGFGGPQKALYVGDEQRVQEFDANGAWKGEIPLAGTFGVGDEVTALTIDTAGNLYLTDRANSVATSGVVCEFDPAGAKQRCFTVAARTQGGEVNIGGLAVSSAGDLAVSAYEQGRGPFGSLYDVSSGHFGHLVTRFTLPETSDGLAFNEKGAESELFAVLAAEVLVYKPVPVAELLADPVSCVGGEEHETDVTLACTLRGEANPWGVPGTEIWFEWGRSALLGERTPAQALSPGSVPVAVSAVLGGVRPNEAGFFYRVAGYDEHVQPPAEEPLQSESVSFTTPIAAPRITAAPSVSFVKASSAVLRGELNPENANTEYFFEYAPGEALATACPGGVKHAACPGVAVSAAMHSSQYGRLATTMQAGALQPATLYHYRLFAESENEAKTERLQSIGPEGSFLTAPAAQVQAVTGPPSALSPTSTMISGAVNPDGQPATYAFELGIDAGPQTQYGIVFSGPIASAASAVGESFELTGLQPGRSYAYRIIAHGATSQATGETVTFTTPGLPAALSTPPELLQLPVPNIAFPQNPTTPRGLSAAQRLAKALKACQQKPKRKRAACRRQAHRKHPAKQRHNNRKR